MRGLGGGKKPLQYNIVDLPLDISTVSDIWSLHCSCKHTHTHAHAQHTHTHTHTHTHARTHTIVFTAFFSLQFTAIHCIFFIALPFWLKIFFFTRQDARTSEFLHARKNTWLALGAKFAQVCGYYKRNLKVT